MPINNRHKIYGIIGENLKHSLSPMIHNRLFKLNKLNSLYTTFESDKNILPRIIDSLRVLEISGVNITYPFKKDVMPFLDKLDNTAKNCGVVNTIKNQKGKLTGFNTDIFGINETFKKRLNLNLDNKRIILLGAGGAARSCLNALLKHNPREILVLNRSTNNSTKMISSVKAISGSTSISSRALNNISSSVSDNCFDFIINSTSANLSWTRDTLRKLYQAGLLKNTILFDMNYGKRAVSGKLLPGIIKNEDGLYMLAAQAVKSFKIWTGIRMDADIVYKYIKRKNIRM